MSQILNDLFRTLALAAGDDQRTVEYDDIERQFHDPFHIGITGPKVIKIEVDAFMTQFIDLFLHHHEVQFTAGFGEFDRDLFTRYVVFFNDAADIGTEVVIFQFFDRDVDADPFDPVSFFQQAFQLLAGLVQDDLSQDVDETVVFSHRDEHIREDDTGLLQIETH